MIAPTYELLDSVRKLRVGWVFECGVQDGHLPHLFKGRSVVTQLVQQDAQRPDIALLVYGLFAVYVNHLRTAVLQRSMPLHIVFDQPALGGCCSSGPGRCRGAKVAELVYLVPRDGRYQDVFDLEVAMEERGFEVVHGRNALDDVGEDMENLGLRQSMLQPRVHEVDETAPRAELHEQKDLVSARLELRSVRVHVGDNLAVSLELLHRLHLGAHVGECIFVGTGYSLQHRRLGCAVVGLGDADEVDVREAALGEVLFDCDAVVAYLDLGARRKGAGWPIGDGDGPWGAVGGLLGHGHGGGGSIASRRHYGYGR